MSWILVVSLFCLLLLKQAFCSHSANQPAMSLTYRSHYIKIVLSIRSNFALCMCVRVLSSFFTDFVFFFFFQSQTLYALVSYFAIITTTRQQINFFVLFCSFVIFIRHTHTLRDCSFFGFSRRTLPLQPSSPPNLPKSG